LPLQLSQLANLLKRSSSLESMMPGDAATRVKAAHGGWWLTASSSRQAGGLSDAYQIAQLRGKLW
jgi:hypothetical protein